MKIRIKNIDYPIRVTLGAQLMFKQDTGREVSEMEGVEDFARYLYACTKSASMADGTAFDIPFDEFINHFDEAMIDEWADMQLAAIQKKTKAIAAETPRPEPEPIPE